MTFAKYFWLLIVTQSLLSCGITDGPVVPFGSTVFTSDNFDRDDSSDLGVGASNTTNAKLGGLRKSYTIINNTSPRVQNKMYTGASSSADAIVETSSTNCTIEVTIVQQTLNVAISGIMFRHSGSNFSTDTFAFVSDVKNVTGGGARYVILKNVSGVTTVQAGSSGITPANGDRLRIEVNDSLKAYVNNNLVISLVDSSFRDHTKVGLLATNPGDAKMDNFIVRDCN